MAQPETQQSLSPLSPTHLSILDSIPYTHVPHTLKQVPPPPNAPPEVAAKTFILVCKPHDKSPCEQCHVDFTLLNYLFQFLKMAPSDAVPPPPNVMPPPQKAQNVTNLKDSGNNAFKARKFDVATQFYTKATDVALNRPPWEQASIGREEAAITLCNRSASHAYSGNWPAALADAETVITLKRPWTKGHFRKARALVGLERHEEARQAIIDGMQYEPHDKVFMSYTYEELFLLRLAMQELNSFLEEIDQKIQEANAELPDTI
nr:translocation protein SEC72 [Cryptococcus depauperatus CBS 7855]